MERWRRTPVHDSAGVHVLQGAAQLDEILPDRSLWDEPPLLLKVLQEGRQGEGQWVHLKIDCGMIGGLFLSFFFFFLSFCLSVFLSPSPWDRSLS